MSIVRVLKNNNYSLMSNVALNDNRLSLKAKGLYAYLMSKPDDWKISYRGLEGQLKEGKIAIMAALNELEDAGYLVRGQVRNDGGRYAQGESILYESPCSGFVGTENRSTKDNTEQVITENTGTKVPGESPIVENSVETVDNPEPPTEPERPDQRNPDVSAVVEAFEAAFQLRLPRMPYQRRAAKTLISRHGLKDTLRLIEAAAASRGQRYAPVILDLEALRDKTNNLVEYFKQKQNNNQIPEI